jgi:hypothetical protein
MSNLIVWDIETVPDLKGFAAANGYDGSCDDVVRAAMGDKFPKHVYHSIICIGALVARREDGHWTVAALGAPHVADRHVGAGNVADRKNSKRLATVRIDGDRLFQQRLGDDIAPLFSLLGGEVNAPYPSCSLIECGVRPRVMRPLLLQARFYSRPTLAEPGVAVA